MPRRKTPPMDAGCRREWYLTFKERDVDNNGALDPGELAECLQLLGMNPSEEDLEFMIKQFDKNGDGKLQIDELLDNWEVLCHHSVFGKEMMEAFKVLDKNGDGWIRLPELLKVLTSYGKNPMKMQDAKILIDDLAKNYGDGKFKYADFVAMHIDGAFKFTPAGK